MRLPIVAAVALLVLGVLGWYGGYAKDAQGELRCEGRGAVIINIDGKDYAVNGMAGSIRLHTSRADIVGDTSRASEIWSALVGGDSRAGTGLSVSTTRVTSTMPPAIRTSATRVFVMARSLFIIPKYPKIWETVGGPHRSAALAAQG